MPPDFFQVGGTLEEGAQSYVPRPADDELLDALARDFIEHGYDLRHTIRLIAGSETYARSAQPLEGNRGDDRYYSHALIRPLEAEVLADALADVTGVARDIDAQIYARDFMLIDQADMIISADMGNRIRTNVTVRSRVSPEKPGAAISVITGANAMPRSAPSDATTTMSDATVPATRRAPSLSPVSTAAAYTGMKDADSVPSPRRLRMTLGILSAAR